MDRLGQLAHGKFTGLFSRLLLSVVLLVLLARLLGFVVAFGEKSLQMDFSSFYTAGRAVSLGLSPYLNHVDHEPPVWDGVDAFRHSRFLYPPLAARIFQPFTWLRYHAAKFVWMLLSLVALAAALGLAVRQIRLRATPDHLLVVGIFATAFYPVLTLLERGQADAFTLLLILAAVTRRPGGRSSLAAGLLLALATLLKLQCIFLLPFLLVRRRWNVVAGFVAGGLVLLAVDLAVDGPRLVRDYAFRELPRISRYGEGGTRQMALPPEAFRSVLRGVEPGRTVMDGRPYAPSYFRFVLNATLAQKPVGTAVRSVARRAGWSPSQSYLAVFFFAVGFLVIVFWQRWCGPVADRDRHAAELVHWQLALVLVLLAGPITWAMGTVWLLPLAVIALREIPRLASAGQALSLLLAVLGLALVGAPDPYGSFMLVPTAESSLDLKYVLGELLCFAGLLGLWRGYAASRVERGGNRSMIAGGSPMEEPM